MSKREAEIKTDRSHQIVSEGIGQGLPQVVKEKDKLIEFSDYFADKQVTKEFERPYSQAVNDLLHSGVQSAAHLLRIEDIGLPNQIARVVNLLNFR